jgi:hypothetical protein
MHLKTSDVIGYGIVLISGLTYMRAKKKTIAVVLFAVGIAILIVSHWSAEDDKKSVDDHSQHATTSGNNSPAMNASTTGSNSPAENRPAFTTGNNSPAIQTAPGSTVNYVSGATGENQIQPGNKLSVGNDSVVIGRVAPQTSVGEGSVIIGPTDSNGNTVISGSMAIGHNASAGEGAIAIGAGAVAGITPKKREITNDGMNRVLSKLDFCKPLTGLIRVFSNGNEPHKLAEQIDAIFNTAGFHVHPEAWVTVMAGYSPSGVEITTKSPPDALLNDALGQLFMEIRQQPVIGTNANQREEIIINIGEN